MTDEVAASVETLRESASRTQGQLNHDLNAIDSDADLSDQGRTNARNARIEAAQNELAGLRDKEVGTIKARVQSLERSLDAKIGYGPTDLIAFRDAQERADRVADRDAASRLMAQALRSDDRTLAHALFRRAREARWRDALDQFAAAYPDSATAANEIDRLNEQLSGGTASLQRSLSYNAQMWRR